MCAGSWKESTKRRVKKRTNTDSQEKLIEYIRVSIGFSAKEAVQIIFLDTQFRFIGEEVYFGTINEVPLYEREVVEKALARKSASIILAHNHPGGSVKPSEGDKAMTMELASACQSVNIKLKDHIIITDKSYFSFKKNGLL
ncbi:JAB domain-containing protein [Wolbachia pipientis]|uniref:JAB domain-containing protein n=1 Tax=Wolbachia pipientis TaxID=955 RepID=UPI0032D5A17E